MQLSRIGIRHFRSLYDIDLPLKPLTILIGPNASGKSNLFKALRFLHDGVVGDIRDWQAYAAQMDELRWYGVDAYGSRPDTLAWMLTFGSTEESRPSAQYEATLITNDALKVTHERLALRLGDNEPEQLRSFYERSGDSVRQEIGHRGAPLAAPYRSQARSSRLLILREEGPNLRLPAARAVYEHVSGWRFFAVDALRARQQAFVTEFPDEVPPLDGNAGNLSAFLYALWRLQSDDFGAINDALADFIDLPQKFLVEHDAERGGSNARYFFYEKPFGENRPIQPESMSDGTIQLLAQLALLIGDRSVTLACLEEPDHGLHPRLMLYLADVLRQTVAAPEMEGEENAASKQVIVTTHSPEFMDCFDLDAEKDYLQVYVAERDENGKTIYIPTSAQEFAPWLERYRLGEAVRRRFV